MVVKTRLIVIQLSFLSKAQKKSIVCGIGCHGWLCFFGFDAVGPQNVDQLAMNGD
jgi:hypothetical protein